MDAQDEYSVAQWMEKNRMPKRISDELFVAMAKALDFIDPDKLSMTVVLTAMNRFLNETDGSQTAFLDGNQPERLCRPMQVCASNTACGWGYSPNPNPNPTPGYVGLGRIRTAPFVTATRARVRRMLVLRDLTWRVIEWRARRSTWRRAAARCD